MTTGTIVAVSGNPGSGLAILKVLKDDDETIEAIAADNGPLFRALHAAFGGIMPGHRFDPKAVIGQRIGYATDDLGVLEAFWPLEDQ